jgi:hypothetical protein
LKVVLVDDSGERPRLLAMTIFHGGEDLMLEAEHAVMSRLLDGALTRIIEIEARLDGDAAVVRRSTLRRERWLFEEGGVLRDPAFLACVP